MEERLQKILSAYGVASRRQAEEMILAGRVSCNGRVCRLGDRAEAERDKICIDGKPLPTRVAPVYIMLYKPRGYVTTLSDEKGRKNVSILVKDCGVRVYPVGRLDMDSEGLLLMTNDGNFAQHMMHPSHKVEKTYSVDVANYSVEGLDRLKQPIVLDGYRIQPPQVTFLHIDKNDSTCAKILITIHEGRNRQVRRMCAIAGMRVRRLVRIAEGPLRLGGLKIGMWRHLTATEMKSLQNEQF